MKCKIFIDTNPIWDNKGPFSTLFNSSFFDLPDFLEKHSVKNVSICLPEIVIKERIQQRLELINSAREYVNEKIRSLKEVGHTEKEIKPRKDYKKKLEKYAKGICENYHVEIVKSPKMSIDKMTELAINKKKPFNDHGSGFKDTLIYFSIIEDANLNKIDTYILCTNNSKQFDQEIIDDFKEKTNKKLIILPDIVTVQQKLDEIANIGLHLEKRNHEVKKVVLNKLGDLMKEINRSTNPTNTKNDFLNPWSFKYNSILSIHNQTIEDEGDAKIAGYNFNDISFSSIEETTEDNFQVKGNIHCEITYKKDTKDEEIGYFNNPYHIEDTSISVMNIYGGYGLKKYKPSKQDFNFVTNCNIKSGSIYIISISGGLFS